jgi:hypothetical protein
VYAGEVELQLGTQSQSWPTFISLSLDLHRSHVTIVASQVIASSQAITHQREEEKKRRKKIKNPMNQSGSRYSHFPAKRINPKSELRLKKQKFPILRSKLVIGNTEYQHGFSQNNYGPTFRSGHSYIEHSQLQYNGCAIETIQLNATALGSFALHTRTVSCARTATVSARTTARRSRRARVRPPGRA